MGSNTGLDDLEFIALAERLAQVRATRTAEGWGTDNAVTKSSLERRILEVVCAHGVVRQDQSRVDVEHGIEVEVHHKTFESEIATIRPGGIWIPSRAVFKDGTHAIVKIRTENNYPLKVKCVVRNRPTDPEGISVAFENIDGASQRRVERLILELLKSQDL